MSEINRYSLFNDPLPYVSQNNVAPENNPTKNKITNLTQPIFGPSIAINPDKTVDDINITSKINQGITNSGKLFTSNDKVFVGFNDPLFSLEKKTETNQEKQDTSFPKFPKLSTNDKNYVGSSPMLSTSKIVSTKNFQIPLSLLNPNLFRSLKESSNNIDNNFSQINLTGLQELEKLVSFQNLDKLDQSKISLNTNSIKPQFMEMENTFNNILMVVKQNLSRESENSEKIIEENRNFGKKIEKMTEEIRNFNKQLFEKMNQKDQEKSEELFKMLSIFDSKIVELIKELNISEDSQLIPTTTKLLFNRQNFLEALFGKSLSKKQN